MKQKSKEFEDVNLRGNNFNQVESGRMGRRNAMNGEDCEELVGLFGQLGMGEDEPSNAMLTIQEEVDRPVAPLNMQVNMWEREDDAQEQKRSREEESDDESSVEDEEVLSEAESEEKEVVRSAKRTRASVEEEPSEDEGMELDELTEVSFGSEMQYGREGDSALGESVTPSRAEDRSLSCNFLRVNENPDQEMTGVVLPSFSFSMDTQ